MQAVRELGEKRGEKSVLYARARSSIPMTLYYTRMCCCCCCCYDSFIGSSLFFCLSRGQKTKNFSLSLSALLSLHFNTPKSLINIYTYTHIYINSARARKERKRETDRQRETRKKKEKKKSFFTFERRRSREKENFRGGDAEHTHTRE